ncbi:restriction endonuclease subunit S [Paucibacter sp. XJ19-41]|uniref:restriction endonuclease subunit S n=1 Tax=Paucibacter sp. XJ19-41 TaxID=2927824 RepID=UPI00234A1C98|nr:restriction endonuclease subunit S [Paucibacter sp. XJ19-41]MDC6166993.1 restriction endonuclease subunit S [Paucibacter sp. XJ19-41]
MSGIPNGWVATSLSEVVFLKTGPFGSALHQSDYIDGGTPLVNPMHLVEGRFAPSLGMSISAEMAERLSEYRLRSGDVVLGRRGEMGRCAVAGSREEGWICGTGSLIVRPDQGALSADYLQRLLTSRSVVDYLLAASVGSTMANLNQQHLLALKVLLPPIAEQTRIVLKLEELLSELDAGVAELKAAQKKLKQYRQSLLKAAVDGSLTAAWRARPENQTPTETGAQLLARILQERRARWEAQQLAKFEAQGKVPPSGWQGKYPEPRIPETAGLPELPRGWVWASVDQLSDEQRYGTSAKTNQNADGVPVLRMGNIQDGELDTSNLKFLPQDHHEIPSLLLRDGDLLFNRTNSPELVGKSAVYRSQIAPCSYASYLIAVRFPFGVSAEFVSAVINSAYGRSWVKAVVTQQVGQANVNGSKLAALPIPVPPLAEQYEIERALSELRSSVSHQERNVVRSLKQSTAQRQNILRAAFSGQLVPQDPADEPASMLLARIRAEREAAQAGRKPAAGVRAKQRKNVLKESA